MNMMLFLEFGGALGLLFLVWAWANDKLNWKLWKRKR